MTKTERLELQNKGLREQVKYANERADYERARYDLILTAWSRVHPHDLAYMRSMSGKIEGHLDIYNGLIYSFGRPDPDGTIRTRLSAVCDE
jgi:hypothetical protein